MWDMMRKSAMQGPPSLNSETAVPPPRALAWCHLLAGPPGLLDSGLHPPTLGSPEGYSLGPNTNGT